ncbi:T9SS type A sorting domain-containing protein [Rubrivirga sp. IMCC45206]|uniref:T9SS type A sorting domain-containing protein n=1 Tax=Rubrivirga sp. IMCC45206 TaxID=3391614 RepID=UPI00398FB784
MRALALTLVLAAPFAAAQTFQSSPIDLTAGGALDPEIACAATASNIDGPVLFWFDRGTQTLYLARTDSGTPVTFEFVDAATLDAETGVDVEDCQAAAFDENGEVLYVALTAADQDFVLALPFTETGVDYELITDPATGAGDGIVGLAPVEGQLYVAVRSDRNNPPAGGALPLADGFYRFDARGEGQTATLLAADADLSLRGLTATATENAPQPGLFALLAISDGDGTPPLQDVVVALTDPTGSPGIGVFANPYVGTVADGSVLPASCAAGGLVDVVSAVEAVSKGPGSVSRTEGIFVVAECTDGVVIVRYEPGELGEISATEATILDDLGRTSPGITPTGTSTLLYSNNVDDDLDTLVFIGSSEDGGADEVLIATGAFVTPLEADPDAGLHLAVGPNPAGSRLTVTASASGASEAEVVLLDVLGRRVADLYQGPLSPSGRALTLDTAAFAPGIYVLHLRTPDGVLTRTVTLAH